LARAGRVCAISAASAAPPTNPPAAPIPASNRAKLSTTKLPDNAHSTSEATAASVPQRSVRGSPKRRIIREASSAPAR
jgi:hypothetical protein